jgi:hypothetical protein
MAQVTDTVRTGAFIVSEANGTRARSTQEFDSTTDWAGAAIPVGQVYAIVGGAAVAFDGDAADGSEVAAGIAYEGVQAGETATVTVIDGEAEVALSYLTYDATDAEVTAALAAIGIKAR